MLPFLKRKIMSEKKPVARTKEQEAEYKKRFDRDHQMVKGRFRFLEVPGGTLVFSFVKWKEDKIHRYSIQDEEIIELPYMVAKHLAQNVYTDVYTNQVDQDGRPITVATQKTHRTSFERLDFDDDSFIPSPIITVDKTFIA
jgi:hypothetical protein